MKILHIITGTNVGGAEMMLFRYLRALGAERCNHGVVSILSPGPVAAMIVDLGVSVDSLGARRSAPSPRLLIALVKMIRGAGPDLVHGWMYHGCLAASAATATMRHPPAVVWGIHHSLQDVRNEKRSTRLILKALAMRSRKVAGISYCSKVSALQHTAFGLSDKRNVLIPNGIDVDEFKPDTAAKARLTALLGIPKGRLIIGNVARNHPMKDHPAMVAATAELLKRGHDVQAVFIGSDHEAGTARQAADRLGISERVTTLETRADIAQIVPGFDVFLLSSAWGEAFPLAVGEAMAAGVPVVVTDVGDCGWLVGDCGHVVAPADPSLQAEAVGKLLALSGDERRARGLEGRRRIEDCFSLRRYVDEHEAFYTNALSGVIA